MIDKREQILARLEAILQTLATTGSGISVYRNRAELEDDELPAYVLLDGNEAQGVRSSDRRGPQIMLMSPQIFWVPTPPENNRNVGLGPNTSERRVDLLSAIMGDAGLAGLAGQNGYVEYRAMESDLNTGAEVQGQFRMDWTIAYVLNFNRL